MNFNDPSGVSGAVIGASIHIEGTISGDENLVIDGRVEGSIFVQNAMVTIAKSGTVRADVQAKAIKVDGEVRGELRGAESVEVGSSGIVIGDIRSPRVMLQDGCQFKGLIDMDYKETSGGVSPDRAMASKKPPAPKALTPKLPSRGEGGATLGPPYGAAPPSVSVAPKLSIPKSSQKK